MSTTLPSIWFCSTKTASKKRATARAFGRGNLADGRKPLIPLRLATFSAESGRRKPASEKGFPPFPLHPLTSNPKMGGGGESLVSR